jgi:hypothetical protein
MVFDGRPHRDLGKKLLAPGVVPLAGQMVDCSDSLLGELTDCSDTGNESNRGLNNPVNRKTYTGWIEQIFDARFWDGPSVCTILVSESDGEAVKAVEAPCVSDDETKVEYTQMEWNFSLFFGLAVQAYEATLTTEETIIDLLVGGIATGSVTNETRDRRGRVQRKVDVEDLVYLGGLRLSGPVVAS